MNITAEAKVGLLVIVAFALLTYASVQLGDLRLDGDNYYAVEFAFEDVAGLNRGARVKMSGVSIGSVESILLEMERLSSALPWSESIRWPRTRQPVFSPRGFWGKST